jgi:hypothetical protein
VGLGRGRRGGCPTLAGSEFAVSLGIVIQDSLEQGAAGIKWGSHSLSPSRVGMCTVGGNKCTSVLLNVHRQCHHSHKIWSNHKP